MKVESNSSQEKFVPKNRHGNYSESTDLLWFLSSSLISSKRLSSISKSERFLSLSNFTTKSFRYASFSNVFWLTINVKVSQLKIKWNFSIFFNSKLEFENQASLKYKQIEKIRRIENNFCFRYCRFRKIITFIKASWILYKKWSICCCDEFRSRSRKFSIYLWCWC